MQLDLQFFIKLLRLKLFCVCLTTELENSIALDLNVISSQK